MSDEPQHRGDQTEHECAVCGSTEPPDNGWIFRSKDVKPVGVEDGQMKWEAKDGADRLCSIDCKRDYEEGSA